MAFSSGDPTRNDSVVVTEIMSALLAQSEQNTTPAADGDHPKSSSREEHAVITDPPAKLSVKADTGLVMINAAPHDADSEAIDDILEELVNAADIEEFLPSLPSGRVHEAVADSDSGTGRHSVDGQTDNSLEAAQPLRLTADVDDAVAVLSFSAASAHVNDDAAHSSSSVSDAAELQLKQPTVQLPQSSQHAAVTKATTMPSSTKSVSTAMLDVNAEMAGLVPAEDREPAVHAMLSLDQEMAGLVPDADVIETAAASVTSISQDAASASQITAQQSVGLDTDSVMDRLVAEADSVQQSDSLTAAGMGSMQHSVLSTAGSPVPEHAKLDLNAEMAGLIPEDSEPAVRAMLSIDQEVAGLIQEADAPVAEHSSTAAVPDAVSVSEGGAVPVSGAGEQGSAETERFTADVDEAVAGLTESAIGGEQAVGDPAAGMLMSDDNGYLDMP